jgi:hypothetical protein
MRASTGFLYLVQFVGELQYFHLWINRHARMSLGKYWKIENLTILTQCVTNENKNTCVGLD